MPDLLIGERIDDLDPGLHPTLVADDGVLFESVPEHSDMLELLSDDAQFEALVVLHVDE